MKSGFFPSPSLVTPNTELSPALVLSNSEVKSSPASSCEAKDALLRQVININIVKKNDVALTAVEKNEVKVDGTSFFPGAVFTEYMCHVLERLVPVGEAPIAARNKLRAANSSWVSYTPTTLPRLWKVKESKITDDSIFYFKKAFSFHSVISDESLLACFWSPSTFLGVPANLSEFAQPRFDDPAESKIRTIVAAVHTFSANTSKLYLGDGYPYFDPALIGKELLLGSYKYYPDIESIAVHVFGVKDHCPLDLTKDHEHTLKRAIWGIANQEAGSVAVHCKMGLGRTGHMILMFTLVQRFMSLSEEKIKESRLLEVENFARFLIGVVNDVRGVNAQLTIPATENSSARTVNVLVTESGLILHNEQYVFAIINAFAVYLFACQSGLHAKPAPSLSEYMYKSLDDWVAAPLHPMLDVAKGIDNDSLKEMLRDLRKTMPVAPPAQAIPPDMHQEDQSSRMGRRI